MKTFKFFETSPFNYYSITISWPKFKWGKVDYYEDYDASMDNANKYSIDMTTSIGYYDSEVYKSIWFILFGFGITFSLQDGY
jgi:hypothetical protein